MDRTINMIKCWIRACELQNVQKEAPTMSLPSGNASSHTQTHLEAESGMVMCKSVATDDDLSIHGIAEYQIVAHKRAYKGVKKTATCSSASTSFPTMSPLGHKFGVSSLPPEVSKVSSMPIEITYESLGTANSPTVSRLSEKKSKHSIW